MLEVPQGPGGGQACRGQMFEPVLTALGSHGGFKPKTMVGFGTKVMTQKRHGVRIGVGGRGRGNGLAKVLATT